MITSLDFKNFGEQLREIRSDLGLTQKVVSEMTGINVDSLRRIENGFVVPKFETLETLSKYYKKDLNHILLGLRASGSTHQLFEAFDQAIVSGAQEREEKLIALNQLIQSLQSELISDASSYDLVAMLTQIITLIFTDTILEPSSFIAQLSQKLSQTIHQFELEHFEEYRYSELEIRALLVIGLLLTLDRSHRKASDIFQFCLNYLNLTLRHDHISSVKMKIRVLYNLAYSYYSLEEDERSLYYAQKGIDLCYSQGVHYCLELLLARKAVAQLYLGDPAHMQTFREAVYHLYSIQAYDQLDYLVETTRESHSIDLSSMLPSEWPASRI